MKATEEKPGARIIFIGDPKKYSTAPNTIYEQLKERTFYGILPTTVRKKSIFCPSTHCAFMLDHIKELNATVLLISWDHVRLLEESEYEEYDGYLKAFTDEINAKKEALRALCNLEPKESYLTRNFSFQSKQELNTLTNIAALGKWDQEKGKFLNPTPQYFATCCAFTKSQQDIQVWIPKMWLNYFGYTQYDQVEWLKFLAKCGIGFEYEFLPDHDLPAIFGVQEKVNIQENIRIYNNLSNSQMDNHGSTGFNSVRIKGYPEHTMITYLKFICLRYMYNSLYWNIPGIAMQIKKTLGAKVSHWEALLMAHLDYPYGLYYNLVAQSLGNNGGGSNGNFVQPFQTYAEVKRKLIENGSSMNSAFTYTKQFKRETLDTFFKEKDYLGLYKYLRTFYPKEQKKKEVLQEA